MAFQYLLFTLRSVYFARENSKYLKLQASSQRQVQDIVKTAWYQIRLALQDDHEVSTFYGQ